MEGVSIGFHGMGASSKCIVFSWRMQIWLRNKTASSPPCTTKPHREYQPAFTQLSWHPLPHHHCHSDEALDSQPPSPSAREFIQINTRKPPCGTQMRSALILPMGAVFKCMTPTRVSIFRGVLVRGCWWWWGGGGVVRTTLSVPHGSLLGGTPRPRTYFHSLSCC